MDAQGRRFVRRLLCVLVAAAVSISLIVLPAALTEGTADPAGGGYSDGADSGASRETVSSEPTPSSESLESSEPSSSSESLASSEPSSSSESPASSGPSSSSESPASSGPSSSSESPASSGPSSSSESPASSGPSSSSESPASSGPSSSSESPASSEPSSSTVSLPDGQPPLSGPLDSGYTYEDKDIAVSAVPSDASALPKGAKLRVAPITDENSKAYREAEKRVGESIEKENRKITGLLAYDIYFEAGGERIEPEAGAVAVTIQYKGGLFGRKVKKATDEIRVLHLKEDEVEDVTDTVDVAELGGDQAETKAQTSSQDAADTVGFVTDSFSTFVVAGITTNDAAINVSMRFVQADGTTLDTNVTGTYYLNIYKAGSNGNGDRYNLELNITNGQVITEIPQLYQNSQLVSVSDGTYSTILYKSSSGYYPKADEVVGDGTWFNNHTGSIQYELHSDIADNYTVTSFSDTIPASVTVKGGSGALEIVATAKTGIQFSAETIMSRLSPVLPFGVFANELHLAGHSETCVAAHEVYFDNGGTIGNDGSNFLYYLSNKNTITVNKTYTGSTQKTFRFGLFEKGILNPYGVIKTLTLDDAKQRGTVTFEIGDKDPYNDYEVNELEDDDTTIIGESDIYDGFTLTTRTPPTGKEPNFFTMNTTSYIGTVHGNGFLQASGDSYPPNKLIVGENYQPNTEQPSSDTDFTFYDNSNNSTGSLMIRSKQIIKKASSAELMPNFDEVLGSENGVGTLETLSEDLAQALTTDTVVVKSFKASDFTKSENSRFTFTLNDGQMLLVNIDATNCPEFSFPQDSPIVVNNQQQNANWAAIAPRILINVYTKDNHNNYAAYTGTIGNAFLMVGTLLAPKAEIHMTGSTYNGRLIGDKVYNEGHEIHSCATGTVGDNVTWTFENTETGSLGYTLPMTGGTGTRVFYGAGLGILLFGVALAAVYHLSGTEGQKRKRRRNGRTE